MRALLPKFLIDLKAGGMLHPILECVQADRTLDLQIRKNNINIYYRGGNILKVRPARHGYRAEFNQNYGRKTAISLPDLKQVMKAQPSRTLWQDVFSTHKVVMDHYFVNVREKAEREFQQLIIRDNNFGKTGAVSDYSICDIEYNVNKKRISWNSSEQAKGMQFDMVAVRRHQSADGGHRLAMIEVKYGDGALEGNAGLAAHVTDMQKFLSDNALVKKLKDSMVDVYSQKIELGLIESTQATTKFSDEIPLMILILANHEPNDPRLRKALTNLPSFDKMELRVAIGSFMGYGLFDHALLTLEDLNTRVGMLY